MAGLRDPLRYREEAKRFLALADRYADEPKLRDGYLALAIQFERVADTLEKSTAAKDQEPERSMAAKPPDPKGEEGMPA